MQLAAKFRNSGQTCVCANRVLVQEGICGHMLKMDYGLTIFFLNNIVMFSVSFFSSM